MTVVYIFIAGALAGLGIAACLYAAYQGYRIVKYRRRDPSRWDRA